MAGDTTVEYAVAWDATDDGPGGIDIRPDREDAEHTLSRYAWPGTVVCRQVGEWQPVEAASNG